MQSSRGASLRLARPALTYWVLALGVLAVDQFTKWLVRDSIALGEIRPFLGDFLVLTYVRNTGAAFGVFAGGRVFFIVTGIIVLAFVAAYWRRSRPKAWPIVVALALVTSGALGNMIDRAATGRVTDFLYAKFIDFPVFNVADMAISIGVVILMAWLLFAPEDDAAASRVDRPDEGGAARRDEDAPDCVAARSVNHPHDAAISESDGHSHSSTEEVEQ